MAYILIVDDSLDDASFLKAALEYLGHRSCYAESGKSALSLLKNNDFDLIISDLQMEGGDGWWLLAQLKNLVSAPPCLIVSSSTSVTVEELQQAGAICFLKKPVSFVEIKRFLDQFLGN